MRTRFLGTDCVSAPAEALEFLRYRPPDFYPTHFSCTEQLQHCVEDVPVLDLSATIQKLPIENSLSKFFSDVLPQNIDVEFGDFTDDHSDGGTACFDLGSSVSQGIPELDSTKKNIRVFSEEKGIKKDEEAFALKGSTGVELVQFEVPEQNYDLLYHIESVQIFSESPYLAIEMDLPVFELRQQELLEMAIYSVDSLSAEYFVEKTGDMFEDSGITSEKVGSSHGTFLLLEIDEACLGISSNISIRDELITFEDVETQECVQEDELMNNENELLGLRGCDLLVHLSNHCVAIQLPELQVPCSSLFEEIDLIDENEDSQIRQVISYHPQTTDHTTVRSRRKFLLEEFQFIDLEPCSFSQVFCDLETGADVEALEELFREAMKFRSFDELIVLHELTLMDDSFKSLPVPILSNSQNMGSLYLLVEESLNELEPESSSTFDSLYLDWHVLEEDNCDSDKHSSCWNMLQEIEMYSIGSSLNTFDYEMIVFNFVLSDDTSDKPNSGESKETLSILLQDLSVASMSVSRVASRKLENNDQSKNANAEILSEIRAEVFESVEYLAQFNDPNFFVKPGDSTRGEQSKNSNLSLDRDKAFLVSSSDIMPSYSTAEVALQQWNVKMYKIKLSDEILGLIDHFKSGFLDILENKKELVENQYPSQAVDDISLLCIPKEKLMHQIVKAEVSGTALADGDENIISLITLCAIKQMAWYLCFYGVHTTYLYIQKLTNSLQCLKCRLSSIQSVIGNICLRAEKEIIKFHPSLSVIKEILQSTISMRVEKLLIVADPVFWWPLKRLLISMNIYFDQPQNSCKYKDQQDKCNDLSDATQSDCCLVSHEYITESFPLNKFRTILEYGGSFEFPRVLTICPRLDNCPLLHFLKVELEDLGASKALCNGVGMHNKVRSTTKGDPHSISARNLEELLNFMPVEENYDSGQLDAVAGDEALFKMQEHCVSLTTEPNILQQSKPSLPDTVIVVNTQNFDKDMVISRRSTYQKILLMEKEGAQVVERDLKLPVDLLVNAAVCLAWYDLKNIGKKSSALDEGFSCLPLCIENIAASVLTSLSFAFTTCILVFEGEKSFIAGIMESSDELYAAAASLGIDFQIFCSYSSDMTDEIILYCIKAANKQISGLYPRMSESETIAESFLTAFPSINPLSAHAILSSGGMLVEFLEWSCDHRIQAVQKYKVPDESVALLSLLSKYGEHEDSKSAMTDSSSVSYTPDKKNRELKSNSGKTKRKWEAYHHGSDMHANESLIKPPKQFFNDSSIFPRAAGLNDFWISMNSEIIEDCGKRSLSTGDELFGYEELEANTSVFTSKLSSLYDCSIAEGHLPSEKRKKTQIHGTGSHSGAKARLEMAAGNDLNRHRYKNSGNLQEDIVGEVIDMDDTSNAGLVSFSPLKVEKGSTEGISGTQRKLFFGSGSFPNFPVSEVNSDSDPWFLLGENQSSSSKQKIDNFDSNSNKIKVYQEHQKGLLQKATSNSQDLPLLEKENVQHCGTPLWNAIHNNESLRKSPWTTEFLNRIKEKSRLRKQSLPCLGYMSNIPKATKRKSPSILECYKYQGVDMGKRKFEQKRQKQSVQISYSSKKEKASASILPAWTPVDKRAKQTLSFATSGNEAQSKLVWSDQNSHARRRRIVPKF